MDLPYSEKDDRYADITKAHKAVAVTQKNIRNNDVSAIAKDMKSQYVGLESAIDYRMRADMNTGSNSLLQIYANGVLPARLAKLQEEFTRVDDGALKATTLKNYMKYCFENAKDTESSTKAIAMAALEMYKK